MLSKVKLYGDLADFVGHKQFDVKVNSVAQAVSFLINNFPETEGYMAKRYYKVLINKYEIDETQIHEPTGRQEISFVPVISGAGGNTGKILLGAALIAGAFLVPGSPLIFGKGFAASLAGAGFGFKAAIGLSLIHI